MLDLIFANSDPRVSGHTLETAFSGRDCLVNLIPYNPTAVGALHGYAVPQDDAVQIFADVVEQKWGVRVKVRWSSAAGRGVDGACGQLVVEQPSRQ